MKRIAPLLQGFQRSLWMAPEYRRPRIKIGRHMSPSLHWSLSSKEPQDQNLNVRFKRFFPNAMLYYLVFCSIMSVYIVFFFFYINVMHNYCCLDYNLTLQSVSKYILYHWPLHRTREEIKSEKQKKSSSPECPIRKNRCYLLNHMFNM